MGSAGICAGGLVCAEPRRASHRRKTHVHCAAAILLPGAVISRSMGASTPASRRAHAASGAACAQNKAASRPSRQPSKTGWPPHRKSSIGMMGCQTGLDSPRGGTPCQGIGGAREQILTATLFSPQPKWGRSVDWREQIKSQGSCT